MAKHMNNIYVIDYIIHLQDIMWLYLAFVLTKSIDVVPIFARPGNIMSLGLGQTY